MIVVDSSVWIDYFRGSDSREIAFLDGVLAREFIVVGDLILAEVLQGFVSERDFQAARQSLARFEFAAMVGRDIALAGARNFRRLRGEGVAVRKTIDVLIATFCIENGHTLLHRDRDFDVIADHLPLRTI